MVRRLILLVVAALIAAAGTLLVFLYAHNADQRAIASTQMLRVLVAIAPVSPGTTGGDASAAGAFELKDLPKSAIADGALSSTASIDDKVALGPIVPGEQILAAKFGAKSSYSQLQIPSGKMALSVQLTDPGRVAGFVTPGAHVAVFAYIKPADSGAGSTIGTGTQGTGAAQTTLNEYVQLLLKDVEVLASGPTTLLNETVTTKGATQTDQIPKAILTLAVSQKDSEKLVYLVGHGDTLYFALLRDDSKVTDTDPPVLLNNLFAKDTGKGR
ncbi:MAG: pilus assembly protein CpaB [Frankiaceae bacterium]|nr:pilus assembly protein CpaB [Frankiaceae bacterium]